MLYENLPCAVSDWMENGNLQQYIERYPKAESGREGGGGERRHVGTRNEKQNEKAKDDRTDGKKREKFARQTSLSPQSAGISKRCRQKRHTRPPHPIMHQYLVGRRRYHIMSDE